MRFTPAEIATIHTRAEAGGLKPTAYIRQCALNAEQPPDRPDTTLAHRRSTLP